MKIKFIGLIIVSLFVTDVMAVPICHSLKEECVAPGETRMIGDKNIPVTLDCWRQKITYECKTNDEDKSDQQIDDRDCNACVNYQEEAQPLTKVCEKVPHIQIKKDFSSSGYQKHTSPGSVEDCLVGSVTIPPYSGTGHGKIIVPKNRSARVGFSDSRHPFYYITIVNETTGQTLYQHSRVYNGQYIELPYSKIQDQAFSFIADRWDQCTCNQPGRMNIYMDCIDYEISWVETCNEG